MNIRKKLLVLVVFAFLGLNLYAEENGIEMSEFIEIGGIKQYINIRGNDINNPVILFLHGGPGSPMTNLIHGYQTGWENKYTIVNWDQRNAGKTYTNNNFSEVYAALSFQQIVNDAWELTQYLLEKFNKEKIIIMGHSWGSIIGSVLVQTHPEVFIAYIGVGQVVNPIESERNGFEIIMDMAIKQNNTQDITALNKLLPYPSNFESDYNKLITIRKYQMKYGLADGMTRSTVNLALRSPYYNLRDNLYFLKDMLKMQRPLIEYLYDFNIYENGVKYEIPIIYIMGEKDILLYGLAQEYFEKINAPIKIFYNVADSGHITMLDNVNEFTKILNEEIIKIIIELNSR